jgi:hypothetical protein
LAIISDSLEPKTATRRISAITSNSFLFSAINVPPTGRDATRTIIVISVLII